MSNLGAYQTLTTLAKKVGGPKNLVLVFAAGGYAVFRLGEAVIKKFFKVVTKWRATLKSQKNTSDHDVVEYTIKDPYSDSYGLALAPGDRLHVLETVDEDVLLVEKMGDANNPYCISPIQLASISDYHA